MYMYTQIKHLLSKLGPKKIRGINIMNVKKEYEYWLTNAKADADIVAELEIMDDAKIEDAFYRICLNQSYKRSILHYIKDIY